MQQHFKKTRIAPTPSGYLHLGNIMSFALTALLARQTGAGILLRIDDLDQNRITDNYVQDVFDSLNFMQLPWDEGPKSLDDYKLKWSQLHRLPLYNAALQQLQESDAVFACRCSRAQLQNAVAYPGTCMHKNIPLDTPGVNWRLKTTLAMPLFMHTLYNGVAKVSLPLQMQHFVVRKKDGMPSYQLASVIDDLHFGIDLVIRGQDLLASTLAQLYLAKVLGAHNFSNIVFHHHPLIMDTGDRKLSKSAGATSLRYLKNEGKTAESVLAVIAPWLKGNAC